MQDTAVIKASQIVVKPKIADIVAAMQPGDVVAFDAATDGPISTARAAASRYNQKLGYKAYCVATTDNGVTYTVQRS